MPISNKAKWISLTLIIIFATGCTSIPKASEEENERARNLIPPPDKALIYVYRNEAQGFLKEFDIFLDNQIRGKINGFDYMLFIVDPGEHEIGAIYNKMDVLPVLTVGGKAYYIWAEIKASTWGHTELKLMNESEGRKDIKKLNLVNQLPQRKN